MESPRIVRVGRERFDEVVDALCDAFRDYPVMRFVLKDSGVHYDAHLAQLVGYFTDLRVSRGWPVLAVSRGNEILAAASVNPPHPAPRPAALRERYERMCGELGEAAIARFNAFADACGPLEPDELHYYVGMIGVRSDCQGRGYARLLLDAVHEMSGGDPDSTGVALTTETERNLPFYRHFGYEIVGQAQVDTLQTWTLFRRNGDRIRNLKE